MRDFRKDWSMWMVALLALAGCAQTVWMKPGATTADFERVKAVCDYQSEMGTPNENIGYGMSGAIASGISEGIRKGTLMQKCMIADGWHPEQAATSQSYILAESNWTKGFNVELKDGANAQCVIPPGGITNAGRLVARLPGGQKDSPARR